MKAAVIYYSLSGNTELAAKTIADKLNADLIKLKPKKELKNTKSFGTYFFGGRSAVFGLTPELINPKIDLTAYDTVILGSPIWAGRMSAPINTFLKNNSLEGKTLCLFACHAGGGAEKGFERLKAKLKGVHIKASAAFKTPLTDKSEAERIPAFCEAITN